MNTTEWLDTLGRDAYAAGRPVTDNPYAGGVFARAWRDGWYAARNAAQWPACANCGHRGPHTPDSGCSLCECPARQVRL